MRTSATVANRLHRAEAQATRPASRDARRSPPRGASLNPGGPGDRGAPARSSGYAAGGDVPSGMIVQRDAGGHARAAPGPGMHRELATDGRDPIAHSGEAHTCRYPLGVESSAVVADLEVQRAVVRQLDDDARRLARVLRGVLERLEAGEVRGALDLSRVAADRAGEHGRRKRRSQR